MLKHHEIRSFASQTFLATLPFTHPTTPGKWVITCYEEEVIFCNNVLKTNAKPRHARDNYVVRRAERSGVTALFPRM